MKTSLHNITSKISQGGSLMVEALAMLALISLVTPTLYKKSAERTTELQDINTATHVRTVLKAIDNYVKVNYQNLIAPDGVLSADGDVAKIDDLTSDEYKAYFPYGYDFEDIKNFGKPKAALRRQGDSVTSFVEFPSTLDLGEVRAARIASIVGSNGGYVNASKEALGVGGVWNLTDEDLSDLGFTTDKSSIVAASSEAINSATTSALENEKYLQRTKVESEDQLWRNTMTTNLYMGNPKGDEAGDRYKILGVDQMIVGSINYDDKPQSLVLTDQAEGGGSAWLAGTLHALSDTFRLDDDYENGRYSMEFGSEDSPTIRALTDESVAFNNGQVLFENVGDDEDVPGATFYVNTQIEKKLDVFGDTSVATDPEAVFRAGENGSYITADSTSVDLLNGNIVTTSSAEGESGMGNTSINTDLQVSGNTKMGEGDKQPTRENWDMRLNVQGNAFVSDILEAGEIDTQHFKALNLHAGGTDYDQEYWWLNATQDGVTIEDPADGTLRFSAGEGATKLYAPTGATEEDSALILDAESELRSQGRLSLYTTDETQSVSVQEGALMVGGHGENADVDINAAQTLVNGGTFNIHDGTYGEVGKSSLYVDPKHDNPNEGGTGLVQMNANVTRVAPRNGGVFEVVENTGEGDWDATGSKILRVSAENFPDSVPQEERGAAELDLTRFRLWDNGSAEGGNQSILTVQLDANASGMSDGHNREDSGSSIYIRRGAIEVEPTSGAGASADTNWGYIEASRFVANNPPHGTTSADTGEYIQPTYTTDYTNSSLGYQQSPSTEYDRYMVNPAYTSVMHDIKLTTRGGARLSDILPDFINKGIYVVNNSYQEMSSRGSQFGTGITITGDGGRLEINGLTDVGSDEGTRWASPFLGVVPAPQCPPGHTRVVTITPANFLMAQAGQMTVTRVSARSGWQLSVDDTSYYNRLADSGYEPRDNFTITGAQLQTKSLDSGNTIYYLGWDDVEDFEINGQPYAPQPLYFQQSTWLKSAVLPYRIGDSAPCNSTLGSDNGCSGGFAGWVAVMGFVYPGAWYNKIIEKISGVAADANDYYWNIFPVLGNTLEAYATVYCYFDRNNISANSFNDSTMVDTNYDQLRHYRSGTAKDPGYVRRLNDPTLRYDNPW